jgi:hypothetical protein
MPRPETIEPAPGRISIHWLRWLCMAAVFAGTCDILFATGYSYLRRGVPPSRVLQFVASGAFGADAAFRGGASTAALGLGLHYLNAFLITAIFFGAARTSPWLRQRFILVGTLYGIVVYVVMNYIVIPSSWIGPRPAPPNSVRIPELAVHMFLIGVPIALASRRAFGRT